MQLKDHDLRQLDEGCLRRLFERDPVALLGLSARLLADLKEARERLNQNPDNSSRPPSSGDPWSRGDTPLPEAEDGSDPVPQGSSNSTPCKSSSKKSSCGTSRAAGKQNGAPGHGRTQVLPVTPTQDQHPSHCVRCGAELPPKLAVGYSGYQEADVLFGTEQDPGLHLIHTQHRLFAVACPHCGHETRAEPYRAPPRGGRLGGGGADHLASDRPRPSRPAGVGPFRPAPVGAPRPLAVPGTLRARALHRCHPGGDSRIRAGLRAHSCADSGGGSQGRAGLFGRNAPLPGRRVPLAMGTVLCHQASSTSSGGAPRRCCAGASASTSPAG